MIGKLFAAAGARGRRRSRGCGRARRSPGAPGAPAARCGWRRASGRSGAAPRRSRFGTSPRISMRRPHSRTKPSSKYCCVPSFHSPTAVRSEKTRKPASRGGVRNTAVFGVFWRAQCCTLDPAAAVAARAGARVDVGHEPERASAARRGRRARRERGRPSRADPHQQRERAPRSAPWRRGRGRHVARGRPASRPAVAPAADEDQDAAASSRAQVAAGAARRSRLRDHGQRQQRLEAGR